MDMRVRDVATWTLHFALFCLCLCFTLPLYIISGFYFLVIGWLFNADGEYIYIERFMKIDCSILCNKENEMNRNQKHWHQILLQGTHTHQWRVSFFFFQFTSVCISVSTWTTISTTTTLRKKATSVIATTTTNSKVWAKKAANVLCLWPFDVIWCVR